MDPIDRGKVAGTCHGLYSLRTKWPSFVPRRPVCRGGSRPRVWGSRIGGGLESDPKSPEAHPGLEADDTTLAGYVGVHKRPPAFEGCDGHPYTVSLETERTPDLRAPVAGYLVFPRWAVTGLGVIGHVESPFLWRGMTQGAVEAEAGQTPLQRIQRILNEAIVAQADPEGGDS